MRVIWNHFYPKKDSDYPPIVQELDFSWPLWPRSGIRSVARNVLRVHKVRSTGTRAKCYGDIFSSQSLTSNLFLPCQIIF